MTRRGVTLLELTVVLTIIGLVSAIALPRLADLRDGTAVKSAIADLGATFSLARQTAITRRTAVAVVFDTVTGMVQLRSAGRVVNQRSLYAIYDVVLAANRDSAVYDARGLGYGASNLTVTIRRGRIVDTLTMSRLGRVRW
ncbi:MAG TPA: GspH/FimT family pseudopilin [Gemmatimonadaceae bacterium]|nr:GspH/FimT family pseudopilin [Gemmatimonadaceae bacterium]